MSKGNKGNKGNKQTGEDFKFDFAQQGAKGGKPQFDFNGRDAPIMAALQKQIGTLVGKSSGYFETLPKAVQERVKALKHLHSKRTELEKKFDQELLLLEKKYEAMYQPLIDRRTEIVTGAAEPKPEELVEVKEEGKTEEPKKEEPKAEEGKKEEENVKGVPEFWLLALTHHEEFGAMITEKDEECLKHLTDVRIVDVKDSAHSFCIEFHFADNEFFEDKVLKKTYLLNEAADGEVMYDHVDATEIKWKAGKNLTMRKVTKTQKKKGKGRGGRGGKGGAAQTVTVEEPTESFFHFFNPEQAFAMYNGEIPEEDREEFDEYGLQEFLEADYELGLELKEKVIPHAVMWYTGESSNIGENDDEEEDDDDEEGHEHDDEDEEDDEEFEPPKDQSGTAQQNPECKQQ